jgi:glycosyltransferase involved in cell wall biosynthesis
MGHTVTAPPWDNYCRAAVFGFLSPSTDYTLLWDLLERLPQLQILLLGGDRSTATNFEGGAKGESASKISESLAGEARRRGWANRLVITGFIPDDGLPGWFAQADLFLAPFKFKSSTGSLMHLLNLNRPVLTSDMPLTRWLCEEGAPLTLCQSRTDWVEKVSEWVIGLPQECLPQKYSWTPEKVAQAYVREISAVVQSI